MAVAFGLVCVEEDAHEAIAAREEKVLRDLHRVQARGLGASGLHLRAPSAVPANPQRGVPSAEPDADDSAYQGERHAQ